MRWKSYINEGSVILGCACASSVVAALAVGISFADISGTIINRRDSNLIAGAAVRLEKNGATTISDSTGRFTLTTAAPVAPRHLLTKTRFTAKTVRNGLLINVAERIPLSIATYSLAGINLSNLQCILTPGQHTIALPRHVSGVRLHRLTAGTGAVMLYEFAVSGTVTENMTALSRSVSAGHSATINFNDVISVYNDHFLHLRMTVATRDTSGIIIRLHESAGSLTDGDGHIYQTVTIGNQVWMAENLRVTTYNDGTPIPQIIEAETWSGLTSGGYCLYNNTVGPDTFGAYGVLYNWYAVAPDNEKKLAPEGWHVPDTTEWDSLEFYLAVHGYNGDGSASGRKTAKAMAAQADWNAHFVAGTPGNNRHDNNGSGFAGLPGGYRNLTGSFLDLGNIGYWWSTDERAGSIAYFRSIKYDYDYLYRYGFSRGCGLSVRLVRD